MAILLVQLFSLILVFLGSLAYQFQGFLDLHFGKISIDQLIFFITTSDGVVGADPKVIKSAQLHLIIRPLIITGSALLIYLSLHWFSKKFGGKIGASLKKLTLVLAFLCAAVSFVSTYITFSKLGGLEYFRDHDDQDYFADIYVPPPTDLAGNKKYNLVLLYVESLETTFSNKDYFKSDLNESIDKAFGKKGMKLTQVNGTNWTMAGMASSQCGIPLASFIRDKETKTGSALLGNSRCIGDYLSQAGYENIFYVGPDLKFSGMNKFYQNHGYVKTMGKDEILESGLPQTLFTGWGKGIHDDALLDLAYDEIINLNKAKKNFNVTIITTDNHAPDGHPSSNCPRNKESIPEFAKVIKCTNSFISKFIGKLEKSGVLKDTVVVIMGDHLFMNNRSQESLFPPANERYVYFNYISPKHDCTIKKKHLTHFDIAPTILDLTLGMKVDQFGLGFNACNEDNANMDEVYKVLTTKDLASHSKLYRSLK